VMRDPHTRDSRGFAFVTMETAEEAEAAIAGLNATDLAGRTINVQKAKRGRARTPTPGAYHGPPKVSDQLISTRPYFFDSPVVRFPFLSARTAPALALEATAPTSPVATADPLLPATTTAGTLPLPGATTVMTATADPRPPITVATATAAEEETATAEEVTATAAELTLPVRSAARREGSTPRPCATTRGRTREEEEATGTSAQRPGGTSAATAGRRATKRPRSAASRWRSVLSPAVGRCSLDWARRGVMVQ